MARELCEEGGGGGFYFSNSNIQSQFTSPTGFGSGGEPAEMFNLGSTGGSGGDGFHHNMTVVEPWGTAAQDMMINNNHRFHLVDDSSLRSCLFPYERQSQGLSLSLSSSNNPSSIGQLHNHDLNQSSLAIFQLHNSKFLAPAQELLYEFCSLDSSSSYSSPKHKLLEDSSNSRKLSLHSLDFMELQKRKTKLFSMLDEVERRYRHYMEKMKKVVASFEAVAGIGAGRVYSALASKAMSRHFRCLKDGIVGEIHATKKAMGEKDPIATVTTRGETPKLRVIDQALRQQRAFHQTSLMESHPWRPQRGLPEGSVSALRAWLFEHFLHPYPSDVDKHILARQTGLSRSQVSNWFINARVRLWKPMVEEMYLEETKEQQEDINNNEDNSSDGEEVDFDDEIDRNHSIPTRLVDQKPTSDQLLRIDSECLSSIISNNSEKNEYSIVMKTMQNHHQLHHTGHSQSFDAFGAMELDFSSYNHHSGSGGVSYPNNNSNHFNNGGGGDGGGNVSLTLGLQQHAAAGENGGGGVSIAFPPAAAEAQSSLYFTRDDDIEDCQPVQYSLFEGETQNLPYRNLMGAQLLNDL